MKIILFIVFLLIPYIVKADESRYRRVFTSDNGKFELRNDGHLLKNQKWSLFEKETGKKLYEISADFAAWTALIGSDGKNIVAIDDYSESRPQDNPEVLQFFVNGQKLRSYQLSELLENRKLVQQSVSHFQWILEPKSSLTIDTTFKLKTFELYDYEFDINTGEILKKTRDSRLSNGAVYAYGDISGSKSGAHQMNVKCLIYGRIPPNKTIKFESESYIYDGSLFHDTVIIKDGKLIDHLGILLNLCED